MSFVRHIALAMLLSACAPQTGLMLGPAYQPTYRAILRESEINADASMTAFEVIRRLRPEFLNKTSIGGVSDERVVYVDGLRMAGVQSLELIRARNIRSVELLPAGEATSKLGVALPSGAIVVRTRPLAP